MLDTAFGFIICRLQRGDVHLIADHTVCKCGQILNPDQAAILKAFNIRMALFKFRPVAFWQKNGVHALTDQ